MEKSALYGMFRARVVSNKDLEKFGRILVWIPDFMPEVDQDEGIWARPANNPIGGRNVESETDNYFAGTSYIPTKGSWVFVFFECGNINRPYYFGALDLENTKVLPENQVGTNYQNKWTLLKSHEGRAIIVSDDPDDERVEITGKKRLMNTPPTGDTFSVYRIDENQTTILLDERDTKQKLLIKTYKGDFINLNIEDRTIEIQVAGNIEVRSGGHLLVTTTGDQHLLSGGSIYLTATKNVEILAGGTINLESGNEFNVKTGTGSTEQIGETKVITAGGKMFLKSSKDMHVQSGGNIATDASPNIYDNSGVSESPPPFSVEAIPASPADPNGDRD